MIVLQYLIALFSFFALFISLVVEHITREGALGVRNRIIFVIPVDVALELCALVVFLGFLIALFAIIGDLVESVIKRSVDIKDSGSIIPGRGGLLDSIDSIVFAAPVFYFGINILYI